MIKSNEQIFLIHLYECNSCGNPYLKFCNIGENIFRSVDKNKLKNMLYEKYK